VAASFAIYEKGVSLRVDIGSLSVYFLVGLFAYEQILASESPAAVANHHPNSAAPSDEEEQHTKDDDDTVK
jgi:hypothetical protein